MKNLTGYFTRGELALWGGSSAVILAAYFAFGGGRLLTLAASLIGAASLIFAAKGNPLGQVLMIAFSMMYGVISFGQRYYGEMATYLGMTLPMSVFSLVSWLTHPYAGDRSQVQTAPLTRKKTAVMFLLTAAVTLLFYFILRGLGTANLLPSTVSVATSFAAAYLTFLRSPWFAAAYACNDMVLIVLWVLAAREDSSCISVIVCFVAFLVNDIYGFYNWKKMSKQQSAHP